MGFRALVLITLAINGLGCTTAPIVVQPTPPARIPPPECLVAADQPASLTVWPVELADPCAADSCREAKARKVAELKELDRQMFHVERERRRACIAFIRGEIAAPEPR